MDPSPACALQPKVPSSSGCLWEQEDHRSTLFMQLIWGRCHTFWSPSVTRVSIRRPRSSALARCCGPTIL